MNRTQAILSRALVLAVPFAVVALAPARATAQDMPPPPPPDAYIATVTPEYFEGRPAYWYNGMWYFRDHGAWNYYRHEPPFLAERRGHWAGRAPARYHYHR